MLILHSVTLLSSFVLTVFQGCLGFSAYVVILGLLEGSAFSSLLLMSWIILDWFEDII